MSIFFIFLHFFRNQTDRKERLYKCSFDYSGKKKLKTTVSKGNQKLLEKDWEKKRAKESQIKNKIRRHNFSLNSSKTTKN